MDTITTIQNLLKSNGSAQPVTVALMPSETRLIASAPDMYEALQAYREEGCEGFCRDWPKGFVPEKPDCTGCRALAILAKVQP